MARPSTHYLRHAETAIHREAWSLAFRAACRAAPVSQTDVAHACGVRPSSVGRWWAGDALPADAHIEPLARLLGLPAETVRSWGG